MIALGEGVQPPHERADELAQLLLERGADVDRPTKHYGGPLGFAAHFGQRASAELWRRSAATCTT